MFPLNSISTFGNIKSEEKKSNVLNKTSVYFDRASEGYIIKIVRFEWGRKVLTHSHI